MRAPASDTLLYDGDCELCRRAVRTLSESAPELKVKSFRDPGVLQALPAGVAARCEDAVQLWRADGSVVEGADAIVEVLRRRWWAAPIVAAQRVPLLRRAISGVYAFVARNRHRVRRRRG